MATKAKKSQFNANGLPSLKMTITELRAAAKAIRDDAARVLGIANQMDEKDPDGKLAHRLQVVGGRLKSFTRAGKRYVVVLSLIEQVSATF